MYVCTSTYVHEGLEDINYLIEAPTISSDEIEIATYGKKSIHNVHNVHVRRYMYMGKFETTNCTGADPGGGGGGGLGALALDLHVHVGWTGGFDIVRHISMDYSHCMN